jgi:hypothetical protein
VLLLLFLTEREVDMLIAQYGRVRRLTKPYPQVQKAYGCEWPLVSSSERPIVRIPSFPEFPDVHKLVIALPMLCFR